MRRLPRRAAWLAAALVLAACDRIPAPGDAPRFEAGDPAAAAIVPDDIIRGLSTDARVLDCPDGVVEDRSAFVPGWVEAHRVDLDGDGADDWLVEGRHRCLAGDDGADWWLYAGDGDGHRLLLAAARARALELLASRHQGFSDLRLQRDGQADAIVQYDGAAYASSTATGE